MQGYDSVAIDADVELGGTDQKFNIAVGRDLQKHFGKTPQFGLLMPILLGTDGVQKMSKSLHNYVGLSEDPLTMYSKLEKTPDSLLEQYFELLTDLTVEQLPAQARDRQKLLALNIVTQYHGKESALQAQSAALSITGGSTTQSAAVPEFSLSSIQFPTKLVNILSGSSLCKSNGDARRQIQGGAIRLDGEKIEQADLGFDEPNPLYDKVLQFGKTKFIRLVP